MIEFLWFAICSPNVCSLRAQLIHDSISDPVNSVQIQVSDPGLTGGEAS